MAEYPKPETLNCCEAMFHGMAAHIRGGDHLQDAKRYYLRALTGSHPAAKTFIQWIDGGERLTLPIPAQQWEDEATLCAAIEAAKRESLSLSESNKRGMKFASEAATFKDIRTSHLWHSLRMLADITEAGGTYHQVQRSIARVGPIHNELDSSGVPIAGVLKRGRFRQDAWLNLDILEFSNGDFTAEGTPCGDHVPLLTRDDLDVAAALAFLDERGPIAPSFSLDRAPSKRTDMRLDRKTFDPPWLAATDFGQSMFFADWLMKSFALKDALPSLTDPLVSGGSVNGWMQPLLMKAVGSARGDHILPDGTRADHGRLEIVVRSIDVAKAVFSKHFLRKSYQYQLNDIDLFIESSLFNGDDDCQKSTHFRRDDPTSGPGAKAAVLMENYSHACDLFPAFERVGLVLATFSIMAQARQDGVELSARTRRRIANRKKQYTAEVNLLFPGYELSPKPFHNGGCYCQGGVSGRPKATVTATQSSPFSKRSKDLKLFNRQEPRGHQSRGGGGDGSDNPPNPYERLEAFAASAQEKYLFDDIPLHLTRDDGTPTHALSKRGPWLAENPERLHPFEAATIRDIAIQKYGNEIRALRELPARPPNKSREFFKDDIYFGSHKYTFRVKYFSDRDRYYESTVYRKNK